MFVVKFPILKNSVDTWPHSSVNEAEQTTSTDVSTPLRLGQFWEGWDTAKRDLQPNDPASLPMSLAEIEPRITRIRRMGIDRDDVISIVCFYLRGALARPQLRLEVASSRKLSELERFNLCNPFNFFNDPSFLLVPHAHEN